MLARILGIEKGLLTPVYGRQAYAGLLMIKARRKAKSIYRKTTMRLCSVNARRKLRKGLSK